MENFKLFILNVMMIGVCLICLALPYLLFLQDKQAFQFLLNPQLEILGVLTFTIYFVMFVLSLLYTIGMLITRDQSFLFRLGIEKNSENPFFFTAMNVIMVAGGFLTFFIEFYWTSLILFLIPVNRICYGYILRAKIESIAKEVEGMR